MGHRAPLKLILESRNRMRGDVLDPLAVDVDLAAVARTFEIFLAVNGRPFTAMASSHLSRSMRLSFKLLSTGPEMTCHSNCRRSPVPA